MLWQSEISKALSLLLDVWGLRRCTQSISMVFDGLQNTRGIVLHILLSFVPCVRSVTSSCSTCFQIPLSCVCYLPWMPNSCSWNCNARSCFDFYRAVIIIHWRPWVFEILHLFQFLPIHRDVGGCSLWLLTRTLLFQHLFPFCTLQLPSPARC